MTSKTAGEIFVKIILFLLACIFIYTLIYITTTALFPSVAVAMAAAFHNFAQSVIYLVVDLSNIIYRSLIDMLDTIVEFLR